MVIQRLHHFTELDLDQVYSLRDHLNQVITSRNQAIISNNRHMYEDWNQQRYLDQLFTNSTDMYASQSGIMSHITDNLESFFTLENMLALTPEETRFTEDFEAMLPPRVVNIGDPVFKIVGNTWYIATYMSNEMVQDFVIGNRITLYLENRRMGRYEPMSLRIENVIRRGLDENLVLFRITQRVFDFIYQRGIAIRTVDSINGLKISNTAIATQRFYRIPLEYLHGELGYYVIRLVDGLPVNVFVDVLEKSESNAYVLDEVEDLRLGDMLIPRDPERESHRLLGTREVQGVFRANHGYAEFRVICLEEATIDPRGFILLEPSRNLNIRQFDSIVTNSTGIRHGQIIR